MSRARRRPIRSRWMQRGGGHCSTKLSFAGDARNDFAVADGGKRVTHLRLNIFPDGGVARLRVHGDVVPDDRIFADRREVDLAAMENGGFVVSCSDMHYGHRQNLILPGRSTHMGDGWETKRRRGPGNDWTIVRLARRGTIERVELDTDHYKGNSPGRCMLECCDATSTFDADRAAWRPLVAETPLQPHTRHVFDAARCVGGDARAPQHLSRRRRGAASPHWTGRRPVTSPIDDLNALPPDRAADVLRACCGSSRWVDAMVARRPFASIDDVLAAADVAWAPLGPDDWREAFSHHPRIGERRSASPQSAMRRCLVRRRAVASRHRGGSRARRAGRGQP